MLADSLAASAGRTAKWLWMLLPAWPAAVFSWLAAAFLSAGLIHSAQIAGNESEVSIRSLFEIETKAFRRLLLFTLVLTVTVLQMVLVLLPHQFVRWNMLPVARWLTEVHNIGLHYALPVLRITLFLIPLLIVLRRERITDALRHDWEIWRNNLRPLLALVLPLMLAAMVLAALEHFAAWQARDYLLVKAALKVGLGLIDPVLSAVWLMATVRLFDQIKPTTSIGNPGTPS